MPVKSTETGTSREIADVHEILFRVLRDDVDVVDGDFLIGFPTFQVLALYVFDDEMVVEARSVVKQHWQEEVGCLVMHTLVAGLLRKLLRFKLEIAVVASRSCCAVTVYFLALCIT